MKHFFLAILLVLGLSACDDGDVIVTTFDFDDINLEVCQTATSYVFYKVNNTNLESLSFKLQTQNDTILTTQDTLMFQIDGAINVVNYRTYDTSLPQGYFCSSIPPSSPRILKDFVSTQGVATFFTRIIDTTYTGVGIDQDTSYVYRTEILFNNLRLENENETVTQQTLDFGFINVTGQ
jgi:hypothetical protein